MRSTSRRVLLVGFDADSAIIPLTYKTVFLILPSRKRKSLSIMFIQELKILQEISAALSSDKRVVKVIAYGSRVRGDFHGDSDLDLMVIVERKDSDLKEKILDLVYDYELSADLSISLSIFSLEEVEINNKLDSPFMKDVLESGKVIYDSGHRGKESPLAIQA